MIFLQLAYPSSFHCLNSLPPHCSLSWCVYSSCTLLFSLLLSSFLNRMSLISLSFLSLPSSPRLTPGSSPDSWQTTLPVWLHFGVFFFFICSQLVMCAHTHVHRHIHTLPVPVPRHSTVLSVCQSLFGDPKESVRGFQGPRAKVINSSNFVHLKNRVHKVCMRHFYHYYLPLYSIASYTI